MHQTIENKTNSRFRKGATVPGSSILCRSSKLSSKIKRIKKINQLDSEKRQIWLRAMKELRDVKSDLLREQLATYLRKNNGHKFPKEIKQAELSQPLRQYAELLDHERVYERMWGISRVANVNVDTSVFMPSLIWKLLDREDCIRSHAAWAIGKLHEKNGGGKIAVPFLIQILGDQNTDFRRHAAMSLGRIKDRSAIAILRRALTIERDYKTRIVMLEALERLKN